MPPLERTPVFRLLHVDRTGHFWVERYPLPTDTVAEWWVFAPDGRLTASVEIPLELGVLEIGEDYLLGKVPDDLDVERVELWKLSR